MNPRTESRLHTPIFATIKSSGTISTLQSLAYNTQHRHMTTASDTMYYYVSACVNYAVVEKCMRNRRLTFTIGKYIQA